MEQVTVIGLGYVGLPVAVAFAINGIQVYGYEKSSQVKRNISFNQQFSEPMMVQNLNSVLGHSFILTESIEQCGTYIICVQTPMTEKHEEDLSFVFKAVDELSPFLKPMDLVIIESTIGIGSNRKILDRIEAQIKFPIEQISYAYCPESILPGNIFAELKNNHRVIGTIDSLSYDRTKKIYGLINEKPIFSTKLEVAELVKLTQNIHRDIEIAFANELSMLCDHLEVNVFELIEMVNTHPRTKILQPGSGVGGHCIAIDPNFMINKYPSFMKLSKVAREINSFKPFYICDEVERQVKKNQIIGVFGFSYKPNINDIRESSGIVIAKELIKRGYSVVAHEPNVSTQIIDGFLNLSIEDFIDNADFFIIAQKHNISDELKTVFKRRQHIDAVGLL